jgi:hypothetical protein
MASNGEEETGERVYQALSLLDKDIAVVVSADSEDLEKRRDASQSHLWYEGDWSTVDVPMACIAVCTWEEDVMISYYLSYDGYLLIDDGQSDPVAQALDKSDDGPSDLVQMKGMRRHENVLTAVGMARLAYQKVLPNGPWTRIDQGLFVPRQERTQSVGLNDVAYDGRGGLVAVGYKGEIWYRPPEGAWTPQESPTNVLLSAIAKNPDKDEYTIVGLQGVVLQGSPTRGWTALEGGPKKNFWSVVYFGGRVIIAANNGLFAIDDGALNELDLKVQGRPTTYFLDAVPGAIWSVGQSDILSSADGVSWTRVPEP